jgi:hypothetical protein
MKRLPIAMLRPCDEEGVRFEPRGRDRLCLSCGDVQYDFREATEEEVQAALAAHDGRLCGRIRVGPDGAPRFRAPRLVAGAAIALALAACGSGESEPPADPAASTSDDGIDHSTDDSTDPDDHAGHVHAHAPVRVEGSDEEAEGMMGHRVMPTPPPTSPPPSTTTE